MVLRAGAAGLMVQQRANGPARSDAGRRWRPSPLHLVAGMWCLELGVDFSPVGSWTIADPLVARGVEPDECYVFGPATGATRPDLAIWAVWTSGGVDKLRVYAELGVREVWLWRHAGSRRVTPYVLRPAHGLQPSGHVDAERSECLAGLDLGLLASFVARRDASVAATMPAYRDALRGLG